MPPTLAQRARGVRQVLRCRPDPGDGIHIPARFFDAGNTAQPVKGLAPGIFPSCARSDMIPRLHFQVKAQFLIKLVF